MAAKKGVQKSAKSIIKKATKKVAASRSRADEADGERAVLAKMDWRGDVLRRVRELIKEADPGTTEEVKWRKPSNPAGVPVWSHDGMICTGETYKHAVKITFAKGAVLRDPAALFNSSLDGNIRRAIDIHEGDEIDESAFKDLIRAAVSLNLSGKKK